VTASTPAPGNARRRDIIRWFRHHGRAYPWRVENTDFWSTFVTEMLLRRTHAEQVARALPDVLERFPCPRAMAQADLSEVQTALGSLGLRWRAANLHASARVLDDNRPDTTNRDVLLQLPGVGPYVADAVRAVAYGEEVLLTDTNSVRIATRVAGLRLEGDVRRRRDVQDSIRDLFDGSAGAVVWWAVIDLAATVCRPSAPRCDACPLRKHCATAQQRPR
jgi:A/G-specific adenine glycosylase